MIEENKKKILIIGAICIILLVGGICYYFFQNKDENYFDFEELENVIDNIVEVQKIEEKPKIIIHILGQVVNAGVIELDEGSRLIDAINKAGGLTSKADITKVNLAYILEDAQKIYIPSVDDKDENENILDKNGNTGVVTSGNDKTTTKKEEKLMVNINTATEEELQKLNGIGSSIASKIVAYRKENGKFNTIEDIKNVSGIGDSKFNSIKDNICVK